MRVRDADGLRARQRKQRAPDHGVGRAAAGIVAAMVAAGTWPPRGWRLGLCSGHVRGVERMTSPFSLAARGVDNIATLCPKRDATGTSNVTGCLSVTARSCARLWQCGASDGRPPHVLQPVGTLCCNTVGRHADRHCVVVCTCMNAWSS
eukprot:352893-Chlamydomonas_euryale.AAC.5